MDIIVAALKSLMAFSMLAQVISTAPYYNVVAYFPLNEDSGSVSTSSVTVGVSQHVLNMDLNNVTWGPGKFGNAPSFDGEASWAVMPEFNLAGTPGTLAMWLNLDPGAGPSTIAEGTENFENAISAFNIMLNDDACSPGKISVKLKGDAGINGKCYNYPGDGWHHYAFVLDKRQQDPANEITLYIDGSVVQPASIIGLAANRTLLSVYPVYFMSRAGQTYFTKGSMDELYIYNGALNTREVQGLYAGRDIAAHLSVLGPDISNLKVTDITQTSATISWNTDKQAEDDGIEYGATASYGMHVDAGNAPSAAHQMTLNRLNPGTTYHFRVTEELGDLTFDDGTFTTLGVADTAATSSPNSSGQTSGSSPVTYNNNFIPTSGYFNQVVWPVISGRPGGAITNIIQTIAPTLIPPAPPPAYTPLPKPTRKPAATFNVDSEPPSVPQNLATKFIDSHEIDLSWDDSTDNIFVTGYNIYRDNELIASTTDTAYVDSSMPADTSYIYTVAAYDAAGNVSGQSIAEVVVLPNGSLTILQLLELAFTKIRIFWERILFETGYRINLVLSGNQQ